MAGQTLAELRALLAAAGLAPRHRYGQNFLIDLNLMRKIVAAAELRADDVVLEVGCGTGSLTELLLEAGPAVIGVEIDHGLQELLRSRLGAQPRFHLVSGDALAGKHEINPQVRASLAQHPPGLAGHYKLVANLPYQIATPLLMELLYGAPPFARLTCTVQLEVAQRLTAAPGSASYGPISVIAATLADVETIARLPPAVFWPRPEVESMALNVRVRPAGQLPAGQRGAFAMFVRRGFLHRRKVLRAAAREWGVPEPSAAFAQAEVSPQARPETLSAAQWCRLFQALHPPES